ncbi:XdhC family protein [Curtobacterium caseinilyticum]|uniref:XdhC family protein n=1 Tax=Curtobacterium caseinilyticum TaxID=3055137 RepID=A0ABT7TMB5_9MICO|nr:XdhC/CoxI family protein [Curtobacterium caseinilyticum]MDM7890723.1 XdhC family protein [Curtobacterium caseinilyticum]
MFELAPRLLAVLDGGDPVVVATAVSMTGSAPSGVGTSMAVLPGGQVVGTISGGCVEGALFGTAEQVLETGVPVLERFGFDVDPDDPDAVWAPALRCGGRVEVLVRRVTPHDAVLVGALRDAAAGVPTSVALSLDAVTLGAVVTAPDGCRGRVFVERADHRPRCVVVGAVETAVAVTNAAAVLGYAVTVVDPRPVFLTDERFPAADERIVGWPPRVLAGLPVDATTVVVVLSHDDRFDAEVVDQALRRGAGYVGAMGSRSTHDRRSAELRALGTPDLHRLRSPIGLDIGARTPSELAVAVMAEVIAARTGSPGSALTGGSGPIHRRPTPAPARTA